MNCRHVYDCFLFYNELDMLEYRLHALNDVVHKFVIVEASLTFTGRSKPFVFENNMSRYEMYLSKIVYVKLPTLPFPVPDVVRNEQWFNEHFQRDALLEGLPKDARDDDFIMLSDIDEIYDPNELKKVLLACDDSKLYVFRQKYHCYNLNVVRDIDWYHPKAFTFRCWKDVLNREPFSTIRMLGVSSDFGELRHNVVVVMRGGWHLSYFGTTEFILNKLRDFSHQEFNNAHLFNIEGIRHRIDNGTDIMERENLVFRKIPVCRNPYLPPKYEQLLTDFVLM